jgi:hypothetical protein
MSSTAGERWLPIPGWEGFYEVSDCGRVRSLARMVQRSTGAMHPVKSRFLTPRKATRTEHLSVALTRNNQCSNHSVHRLVMAAFVGPCPEGLEVLHRDDNPRNNHLGNLRYGTRSENHRDRVRNGIHHNARRTHCIRGHEFTPDNTIYSKNSKRFGNRACRTCKRLRENGAVDNVTGVAS